MATGFGRLPDGDVAPTEILAGDKFEKQGIQLKVGAAAAANLVKGTVMGMVTATKLWAPYDNAAVDGREVARGILDDMYVIDVNKLPAANKETALLAAMYVHGAFYKANLTGLDAAGETDLGMKTVGHICYI